MDNTGGVWGNFLQPSSEVSSENGQRKFIRHGSQRAGGEGGEGGVEDGIDERRTFRAEDPRHPDHAVCRLGEHRGFAGELGWAIDVQWVRAFRFLAKSR
jgi:hypothetical protein